MKNILKTNLLIIISLITLSCNKDQEINIDNGSGSVSFALENTENSSSTRTLLNDDIPAGSSLKITLETTDEIPVATAYTFGLIGTNGQWISPILVLESGDYNLTEFIIYNSDNEAIYVTPMSGSDLAGDIEAPLPIPFSIEKDLITEINAQVVNLEDLDAADAGYLTFDIETISYFFVSVFIPESGDMVFTDAEAFILQDEDTLTSIELGAEVNRIPTELDKDEVFTLVVVKSGYAVYREDFSRSEISDDYYNTLPVVLTPALTFITTHIELASFTSDNGPFTVDYGDGTLETLDGFDKSYINHTYEYNTDDPLYTVSITGPIESIQDLSFFYQGRMFELNLEHLTGLTGFVYSFAATDIPPVEERFALDLSHNTKLTDISINYSYLIEDIILPDNLVLESFEFWGIPLMNTIEDTDYLISTLYNSVTTHNTQSGKLILHHNLDDPILEFFEDELPNVLVTEISEESRTKMNDLADNYNWYVYYPID